MKRALSSGAFALLAVLMALLAENLLVLALQHRQLVAPWEVRRAIWGVTPLAWLLAAPVAISGRLWLASIDGWKNRPAALVPRLLLSAGAFLALAYSLTTGRHFDRWLVRVPAILMIAAAATAGLEGLAQLRLRLSKSGLWLGLCLLAPLVLGLANQLILPRLYPGFHIGLAASAWFFSGQLGLWLMPERNQRPWSWLVYPLLLAAGSVSPLLAKKLRYSENLSFLLHEHSPSLRYALLAAKGMWPAPPLAKGDIRLLSGKAGKWHLGKRSILLVSVDALRADHLGAYGYGRTFRGKSLTPVMDTLARDGVTFERAYCATPHTSYSVTSMLTGKYMRPLLLQDVGDDSLTLAKLLRTYGYKTAAFYPPAIFYIDRKRFESFDKRGLDFEYRRKEFVPAARRPRELEKYLKQVKQSAKGSPVFAWVHFFEPHEPYEIHPNWNLGSKDIDRYDSEIAATDAAIGKLLKVMRSFDPHALVVLTADHGEEFGEHGGRYHGSSVYEEQVRVPLIFHAPDVLKPRRVKQPSQTIDIAPTILAGLNIPRPARLRGRSLGRALQGNGAKGAKTTTDAGFAFAETDDATMLAEGPLRLICARRIGACRLYDIRKDPGQKQDTSSSNQTTFQRLRKKLLNFSSSHGRYEQLGLRKEGKGWPPALRRGIAGDGDAAVEIATLLDDADKGFRRKAAEVLFELRRKEAEPAMTLALNREEDPTTRRWLALGLTRLGHSTGLALDLIGDKDIGWRRLAALALAETGDGRGEATLVAWWRAGGLTHQRSKDLLAALGKIQAETAVGPLTHSLKDVRLKVEIAKALAAIGSEAARPALLKALAKETYIPARQAFAQALVSLGAKSEMASVMVRLMGLADPLPGGLALAQKAGFLQQVGGPDKKDLKRLRRAAGEDISLNVVIPKGKSRWRSPGASLLLLAKSRTAQDGNLLVNLSQGSKASAKLRMPIPSSKHWVQLHAELPNPKKWRTGRSIHLRLHIPQGVAVHSLAVVGRAQEIHKPKSKSP